MLLGPLWRLHRSPQNTPNSGVETFWCKTNVASVSSLSLREVPNWKTVDYFWRIPKAYLLIIIININSLHI